jgi:hypothetical protein
LTAESREQKKRAGSREQRTESREQRANSREQRDAGMQDASIVAGSGAERAQTLHKYVHTHTHAYTHTYTYIKAHTNP